MKEAPESFCVTSLRAQVWNPFKYLAVEAEDVSAVGCNHGLRHSLRATEVKHRGVKGEDMRRRLVDVSVGALMVWP